MNQAGAKLLSHKKKSLKVLRTRENVNNLFLEFAVFCFCGCRLETDWMSDWLSAFVLVSFHVGSSQVKNFAFIVKASKVTFL